MNLIAKINPSFALLNGLDSLEIEIDVTPSLLSQDERKLLDDRLRKQNGKLYVTQAVKEADGQVTACPPYDEWTGECYLLEVTDDSERSLITAAREDQALLG